MSEQRPVKVAIIGVDVRPITAAFELTRPEHYGRYQVTVYQLGWRLGGKGASGRGVADRIEEHGLHLWMGWYENAFRLMRECYAELNRDRQTCPIADWRDAFAPADLIGCRNAPPAVNGGCGKRRCRGPAGSRGPLDAGQRWSMAAYVQRSLQLLRELLRTIQSPDMPAAHAPTAPEPAAETGPQPSAGAGRSPGPILDAISGLLKYGELASLAGLIQAVGCWNWRLARCRPTRRTSSSVSSRRSRRMPAICWRRALNATRRCGGCGKSSTSRWRRFEGRCASAS